MTTACKVLLIDDTPEDRVMYRRYLTKDPHTQYEILEADKGGAGLALAQTERPDCILLDYALPDMDGLAVLSALKESVAVVMLTGTDEASIAVEAMKRGAQDFLTKGRFDSWELHRAVQNAREKATLRRQLNEQREWLRVTLGSIGDAVLATDVHGRVTFLNEVSAQLTGWTQEEAVGHHVTEVFNIINEYTRATVESPVERTLREGVIVGLANHTLLLSKDGREIPIDDSGAPIRDEAGRVHGAVLVFRDISERHQAELEREELLRKEQAARAEAEAANQAKDEFLALVSHELRNPLNAMLGWTRTLRGHADAQVQKVLEIVERNGGAQNQLIEDLLDAARLMTGKLRLDVRPLDLLPVMRAAIDVMRPAAEAREIALYTDYQLDDEQITADPDRLQQVIWNLLSNAIKFTSAGGAVSLRVTCETPHVAIQVTDTGKGIAPELLPHVFERFRQGSDSGAAQRTGGLGLGLSLVKQLTELHGGTVSVASDGLGLGATFTLKLPLRATRSNVVVGGGSAAAMQGLPELPLSLVGIRVLLLEDEEEARKVLSAVLQHYGAEVRMAASTQEAFAVLTALDWRPEILLCDIGLPDEDGYAFMRRVRALPVEQGGALPAIAVTSFNRQADRLAALQAGYQMHLSKPVEPLEFAVTVASLLNRQFRVV